MTIDHVGAILYTEYIFLRLIGRLAFPIFCYLIILGIESTRNLMNYFKRLFIFAIFSQIPYFLAFGYKPFESLNIFFTLSFGVLFIHFYRKDLLLTLFPVFASLFLNFDFSLYGIILIGCMHVLKKNTKYGIVSLIFLNILFIPAWNTQIFSLFALPIILLHKNGYLKIEREVNEKFVYSPLKKYIYYVYYPLHLTLFYLIK